MADIDASLFIENQQLFAQGIVTGAAAAMGEAINVLNGLASIPINPNLLPTLNLTPPVPGDPGAPPIYTGPHFIEPQFDAKAPTLTSVPGLNLPDAPAGPPALLSFDEPILPVARIDGTLLDGVPAVDTTLEAPEAPDLLTAIQGMAVPTLIDLSIPPAPTYLAPQFQGVRPLLTATQPTGLDVQFRQQFDTIFPTMRAAVDAEFDSFMASMFPNFAPGMAAIEARLATYLAGGTALLPEIEEAIYQRDQNRISDETERAMERNLVEAARSGFTIPSVILLNLQKEVDQDGRGKLAVASNEIAIKQAELEQTNLHFAVQWSANLRRFAIDAGVAYYGHLVSINGQALQYAREVVAMVVQAFDIATKYAEIQARLYEADARIYEARLAGAKALIDVYAEQVRAEEAKAQVNTQLVAEYRERVGAVEAEAQVYAKLVEGLVAQASLQRLKVEVYDARVRAYGSQVNAATAEFQGYEAAVRGQAAKIQASAEGVRAFGVQTQAYGEVVRAKATAVESATRVNEVLLKQYQTALEAYRTQVMGQAEAIKAEVMSYDTTIKAFIAKAEAISRHSQSEIASYEAGLRAVSETARIFLEQLQEYDRLRVARAEGIARVAVAAGEQYAHLAASTMSGLNALVSQVTSVAG